MTTRKPGTTRPGKDARANYALAPQKPCVDKLAARDAAPPPLPVTISLARLALLSTDKAQCFQTVWQQMLHSSRCFRSNPGEPGKPTTPQPKPKSKNSSCPTSSSFPTFIGTSSRKTPKQEPEPSACTPRTLHEVESFNFLIETSRAKNRDLSTCDPGL